MNRAHFVAPFSGAVILGKAMIVEREQVSSSYDLPPVHFCDMYRELIQFFE